MSGAVTLYGHRLGTGHGTGISVYVRQLVTALARVDDVRYQLAGSPEPASDPPPSVGLDVHRPPGPRKLLHGLWTTLGRPPVDRWAGRPGLLHVLYPSCPVPSRCPVVYTVHDLMPLTHPEWFATAERRMFERAAADAARRAVALVANSSHTARGLVTRLGVDRSRIEVVPLGISGVFREPVPAARAGDAARRRGLNPGRYVVALGAVSNRKNPFPVIEALPALPGLDLVLVGPPGPGADGVEQRARALGVHGRVRMTGWLAGEEVAALLAGAAALVHPSLDEGFGITPLEAMAAGVPAVVSAAGALPETVGDAAVVVGAPEPAAWAEAIGTILEDRAARAALVERGRARAASFTWERTARETAAVHRRLLSGRAR